MGLTHPGIHSDILFNKEQDKMSQSCATCHEKEDCNLRKLNLSHLCELNEKEEAPRFAKGEMEAKTRRKSTYTQDKTRHKKPKQT